MNVGDLVRVAGVWPVPGVWRLLKPDDSGHNGGRRWVMRPADALAREEGLSAISRYERGLRCLPCARLRNRQRRPRRPGP